MQTSEQEEVCRITPLGSAYLIIEDIADKFNIDYRFAKKIEANIVEAIYRHQKMALKDEIESFKQFLQENPTLTVEAIIDSIDLRLEDLRNEFQQKD